MNGKNLITGPQILENEWENLITGPQILQLGYGSW